MPVGKPQWHKPFASLVIARKDEELAGVDQKLEVVSDTVAPERLPSPTSVGSPLVEPKDSHRGVRYDDNSCRKDTDINWQILLLKSIKHLQFQATPEKPSITASPLQIATTSINNITTLSINEGTVSSLSSSMTDDTIIPVDTPQTFHAFTNFPPVIRKAIWSLNMPGPRLVEVIEVNNNFAASAEPITNLYVCRESRKEALKTHPLSFSVDYNPPLIPFDFNVDTLLLGRRLMDEHNHIYFRNNCHEQELAKLRRLIVDAELVWDEWQYSDKRQSDAGGQRDRGQGLCGISRLVFTGLEEYTALYTGGTDPLPYWANVEWFPTLQQYGQEWRCNDNDPAEVYRFLHLNWRNLHNHQSSWRVASHLCQFHRYGGIPRDQKWEPAIRRWAIPRIYTLGVDARVIAAFTWEDASWWAAVVMDRAIGDLFY